MREIKFRFWDIYTEDWCVDGREETDIYDFAFRPNMHWSYLTKARAKERVIIEQYTGLKDKNGKETYEGDIVKLSDNPIHEGVLVECVWLVKRVGFYYIFLTGKHKDKMTDMIDDWRKYEVIGNIHDNPELLKETK